MHTITIFQQTLNVLRSMLELPGWVKTPADVYLAGKLLVQTLPAVDVSWAPTSEALAKSSTEDQKAFKARETEWCDSKIELKLDEKERELIRLCLTKNVENLRHNKYTFDLYNAFGFSS